MDNIILCVSFLQPKDLTIPLDASLLLQHTQQINRCIFLHIWCDEGIKILKTQSHTTVARGIDV